MEDVDPATERITSALSDSIKAGELGEDTQGMPGAWLLIGTYYDSEGEQRMAFLTNEGSRLHETLGLLRLGQAVWDEEARNWVMGNRED